MKSQILLNITLLLLLFGCSPKENTIEEEEQKTHIIDNESSAASSIIISSNKNSVNTGDIVKFASKVTFKNGKTKDKSLKTVFFVNDTKIEGNKYIAKKAGVLKVKAKYSTTKNTVKSKDLSLKVNETALPASFTKKVVVEDYTATWCGMCPRVSYALELLNKETNKVFSVGIHFKDNFANKSSNKLVKINDVQGFPTAYVNRSFMWEAPQEETLEFVTNKAVGNLKLGLSVSSVLSGGNMQITIGTGISQSKGGLKLVVFILEDGVTGNQSNGTPYYGGAGTIKEFVHNHILRHSVTNVLGDSTPNTTGIHYTSYAVSLNKGVYISNPKNIGVLAMLVDRDNGTVINAQYAKVDTHQKFD